MNKLQYFLAVFMLGWLPSINAQTGFYFGADLSYVNELEDCGAVYSVDNTPKDVYQIFADSNCNLVRLRLWHTPSWYDGLNSGNRYSDLADVKKSIQRAKSAGMEVLLAFHLSDTWADPAHQIVPAAWAAIVNDLPVLKDSLYQYVYETLLDLHQNNLLPEMVQIGNETNRGILLSQAVNDAGWSMDWNRNSQLFNAAIQAVQAIETLTAQSIEVAIHIADPAEVQWYVSSFISNGVTDFDIIGISYYPEWHGATTIPQLAQKVAAFKQGFNREIMIFEAGYPWTSNGADTANNILATTSPAYTPLSPATQRKWLIDLTMAVKMNGGKGVIYWEPAWVSSNCSTQWAQGSHYENATFFDFNNNLQPNGGIGFMTNLYGWFTSFKAMKSLEFKTYFSNNQLVVEIDSAFLIPAKTLQVTNISGQVLFFGKMTTPYFSISMANLPTGAYTVSVYDKNILLGSQILVR